MFQVFDEINVADGENKTANLAVSNYLLNAVKCKEGGKITMGIDDTRFTQIINQMAAGTNEKIVLLLVVDRAEYDRVEKLTT